ncbi:MAG TPA: alpha/beta hydrolase [Thermoplasmata archaeon]|nr:alpha/beta hydrolase [Thermoplasmata archaeon]
MATARVGDSQLFYRVEGRHGDPVVLIHGSLSDHHTFDRARRSLAVSLQVLVYDRRGYGESTGPAKAHAVADDAADLAGLLEAANLYPAHLVAHSYGGAVAIRLAVDRPELVRSLALHEPPFIGLLRDDPETAAEGERLERGAQGIRALIGAGRIEEASRLLVDEFSGEPGSWDRLPAPTRQVQMGYATRWDEEFRDPEAARPRATEVRELLLPVLLTVGGKSPPFLHRIVDRLGDLFRNASVENLRDVGHVPQLAQPEEYAGVIGTFLLERDVPTT